MRYYFLRYGMSRAVMRGGAIALVTIALYRTQLLYKVSRQLHHVFVSLI